MVTEASGASGWKQSAHTVADRAACSRKSRTSSAVRAVAVFALTTHGTRTRRFAGVTERSLLLPIHNE
jgi:hypothetical protein